MAMTALALRETMAGSVCFDAHIAGMQLGAVHRRTEPDGPACAFADLAQIPSNRLKVLGAADEVAAAARPAQILDLADVAAQNAGQAVCLDVEENDGAVDLSMRARGSQES